MVRHDVGGLLRGLPCHGPAQPACPNKSCYSPAASKTEWTVQPTHESGVLRKKMLQPSWPRRSPSQPKKKHATAQPGRPGEKKTCHGPAQPARRKKNMPRPSPAGPAKKKTCHGPAQPAWRKNNMPRPSPAGPAKKKHAVALATGCVCTLPRHVFYFGEIKCCILFRPEPETLILGRRSSCKCSCV